MRIRGLTKGVGPVLWAQADGYWTERESEAAEFCQVDADRRIRVNNANNRFLDPEDQIEAEIVESR